jgi:uncharacterized BrkB/YihY/UPF0761 family membrane protein
MKGGFYMIFPLIPILAVVAIIGGGGTLAWYSTLDDEERDFANELAFELFEKTVEELNRGQSRILRQRFFG